MTQKSINIPNAIATSHQKSTNLNHHIFTPVTLPHTKNNQQIQENFLNPAISDDFHNAMGTRYHRRLASQSPNTTVAVIDKPKISFSQWLLNSVLVSAIFALTGLLIDFLFNIFRALNGVHSESVWLFFPILSLLGLVFGVFFGTKALDVIFGIFHNTSIENNPSYDDGSFSGGILKATGFGLLIAIVGWLSMMILF